MPRYMLIPTTCELTLLAITSHHQALQTGQFGLCLITNQHLIQEVYDTSAILKFMNSLRPVFSAQNEEYALQQVTLTDVGAVVASVITQVGRGVCVCSFV